MTALPAPRGRGPARATRDDWLDLALALLARQGVEAVTVLDLSQRLGVSRSSFYWHFRSRDRLIATAYYLARRTGAGALP